MNNELKQTILQTNYFDDNHYLDQYVELILQNINKANTIETNKHHIIPVSCWKLLNKPIDEALVVNLLPKDHLFAHYLLALCANKNLKYKLQSCFLRMSGNTAFSMLVNWDEYKDLNKIKSEFANKRRTQLKGCKLSEERCTKISLNSKKMWANPEHKANMCKKMQSHWDNMSDAERELIGNKISNTKKGTKCNYATEASYKKGLETRKLNGTLVRTDVTKQKISNTLKGHQVSEETRQKISFACKGKVPLNAKAVICVETQIVYQSARNAELQLNLPKNSIYRCITGKQKSVKGYHWKYAE